MGAFVAPTHSPSSRPAGRKGGAKSTFDFVASASLLLAWHLLERQRPVPSPVGAAPRRECFWISTVPVMRDSRRGRRSYELLCVRSSKAPASGVATLRPVGAAPRREGFRISTVPVMRDSRRGAAPTIAMQQILVAGGAVAGATKPNVAVRSPFPPRRGGKGVGGIGGEKKPASAEANQPKPPKFDPDQPITAYPSSTITAASAS